MASRFWVWLALVGCSAPVSGGGPRLAQAITAPHHVVEGARAEAVFRALDELRPETQPAAADYELSSVGCVHVMLSAREGFFSCTLTWRGSGGDVTQRSVRDPRAENLHEALRLAGADFDIGQKMPGINVRGVKAKRTLLTFDDVSNHHPETPNVTLEGSNAAKIMDALLAVGIKEDDGSTLIVCPDGPPSCTLYGLHRTDFTKLDAARSTDLWRSFMEVAASAHVRTVQDIPLDQVTVMMARQFTHDGKALRFVMTVERPAPGPPATSATSPPPPPPRPSAD
jgi:hypothetical protein